MFSPTMTRNIVLFGLFGVIIYNSLCLANAEEEVVTISCRKMMTSMGKRMFKIFGNCSRELKKIFTKKDEMAEKFQCVVKCALNKTGLLDEQGKVTKATLKAFMDASVPEVFHELGFELTHHCIEDYSSKLDPNEEFCTSYGDMVKCMQETMADYTEFCK